MARKKKLYLDYAATTPAAPDVIKAMQPYWSTEFGNSSSLHSFGVQAKKSLAACRKAVASLLNCLPSEVVFTSGGTESINLALKGSVQAQKKPKQHIISTVLEHPATNETLNYLKQKGHAITRIPCDHDGIVDSKAIIDAIQPSTTLISVIMAQNEIGTLQPIAEIGKKLIQINRQRKAKRLPHIAFHADAAQVPSFLAINLQKLHVDLLSLDASKTYGPKGIGLLYVRRGTALQPQLLGGGQERSLRSGTEPVALIAGFAASLQYVAIMRKRHTHRIQSHRDYMIGRIIKEIPESRLAGHNTKRLSHIIYIVFANIEGESLVLHLDRAGIAASTGAACSTGDSAPSPMMAALGLPKRYRGGSLRLSLGYAIRKKDIDHTVIQLKSIITTLRR